jgi:hypothetical protein
MCVSADGEGPSTGVLPGLAGLTRVLEDQGGPFAELTEPLGQARYQRGGLIRKQPDGGDAGVLLPGAQHQETALDVGGDADSATFPALVSDPRSVTGAERSHADDSEAREPAGQPVRDGLLGSQSDHPSPPAPCPG